MQIQTRKQVQAGKTYREFSRKMYTQFKKASPDMRESQIVKKIIKEWDAMSNSDKKKYMTIEMDNNSSTPNKESHNKKVNKSTVKTTGVKKQEQRSSSKGKGEKMEEEEIMINQFKIDQVQNDILPPKQKTIRKVKDTKTNDYMSFYRFYYQQLMKEHPNWTPNRATIIIKLLWRKRKAEFTKKETVTRMKKAPMKLSARKHFRKVKGLSASEAKQKWARLPTESKILWEPKHEESNQSKKLTKVKMSSNMQMEQDSGNKLMFLRKK